MINHITNAFVTFTFTNPSSAFSFEYPPSSYSAFYQQKHVYKAVLKYLQSQMTLQLQTILISTYFIMIYLSAFLYT